MCNLYAMTSNQEAIRNLFGVVVDNTGNMPSQPGVYPDYSAPIVRNSPGGRELTMARWGMPTPPRYLEGKKSDPGVTNIRNPTSPHWRRWLNVDSRCLVPFNSFAEPDNGTFDGKAPVWFAFDETRPLACFAGLWCRWTGVRKVKEGAVSADVFGFLTVDPNAEVGAIHPKAMPVVLRTQAEVDVWMSAPPAEALKLQRPLSDGALRIVAHGTKTDEGTRRGLAS
jgi:putative SOS response-associated peptidase YedK